MVADPNAGENHGFTVDDIGFEIVDRVGLDYDAEAWLMDTATDSGEVSSCQFFATAVLDMNEAPADEGEGEDDENPADGKLVKMAVIIEAKQGESLLIDSEINVTTDVNGRAVDNEGATKRDITIKVIDGGTFTV